MWGETIRQHRVQLRGFQMHVRVRAPWRVTVPDASVVEYKS